MKTDCCKVRGFPPGASHRHRFIEASTLAWLLRAEDAVPADDDRNRAVRSSMPAIVSVVADAAHRPDETSSFLLDVSTRLSEAARTGAPLEVILVVRGRIEPVPRKNGHRWRLRTARGHVVTFRPEFVVAFNGAGGDEQPTKPHR